MSWELGFGLGALLLAIVLAYGLYQSRHAGRAANLQAEIGAHQLYEHPEESDKPPRGGRRKAFPPLAWLIVGIIVAWLVFAAVMARRIPQEAGLNPPRPAAAGAQTHPGAG